MYIVSIKVAKRTKEIPEVQDILTKYGDNIDARLGLHNLDKETKGLIIIAYNNSNIEDFVEELNTIRDVNVNYMEA